MGVNGIVKHMPQAFLKKIMQECKDTNSKMIAIPSHSIFWSLSIHIKVYEYHNRDILVSSL